MSYSKYIIVEKNGIEVPIIFGDLLSHISVARGIDEEVISAGMFDMVVVSKNESLPFEDDTIIIINTFGKSVTLNKVSRKKDAKLIKKMLME